MFDIINYVIENDLLMSMKLFTTQAVKYRSNNSH